MSDHPILFSGPMVKALLDGRKMQTRRVIDQVRGIGKITEFQKSSTPKYDWQFRDSRKMWNDLTSDRFMPHCPYGQKLDFLWVRETWATHATVRIPQPGSQVFYRASVDNESHYTWRPSIHMPRWASRITLEITGVRVERVQEITPLDALAEGITPQKELSAVAQFAELWETLNAQRGFGWKANPWVWVIEFKQVAPAPEAPC